MSDIAGGEITSADVRFPASEGGVHTYHVGDSVTFTDKWKQVHTGPVTRFERVERDVYATVRTLRMGLCLVSVRHLLPAEHPRAVAMARPVTHLHPGTVVRVSMPAGKSWGGLADGELAAVLADKGQLVNVARLGGAGGHYARLPHDALAVVTADPRTGTVS
jgi:hypothetical protein